MSTTGDTFRRENWEEGEEGKFSNRARFFFFFLAKLLFEKFSQVPGRRHVAIRIAICSNVT